MLWWYVKTVMKINVRNKTKITNVFNDSIRILQLFIIIIASKNYLSLNLEINEQKRTYP